jgi:HlyD family secretion protein
MHFWNNRPVPALVAMLLATACSENTGQTFPGYVEGEYLYLAAPQAGYLQSLDSRRGERVEAGQTVFEVGADPDYQVLAEAESRAKAAEYKLENLKQPHRQSEIAALEANLQAAQAQQRLTHIQLDQQQALLSKHFVAQIKLDESRAANDQAIAEVAAIKKQIATLQDSLGRKAEIRSAQADLQAARAAIAQKRWTVDKKTVSAPAAGEINETYYQSGEWVPPGAAVASLLPDSKRRLRFFIPETELARIHIGDSVEGRCDACDRPIAAAIDFIAPEAEYTPPVIYSRGSREKLVFRVEAAVGLDLAGQLRPGLPVDVYLVR